MFRMIACGLLLCSAGCATYAPVQRDANLVFSNTPVAQAEKRDLMSLWGVGPRAQDRISYPDDHPEPEPELVEEQPDTTPEPVAEVTPTTDPVPTPDPAPTTPTDPGPGLFPGVPSL